MCNFDVLKKIYHKMKKIIFSFLIVGLFIGSATAQEKTTEQKPKKKLFRKAEKEVKEIITDEEATEVKENEVKPNTSPTVIDDMKAAPVAPDENAPVFKFMEESFDFGGEIIDGEKVTHKFTFTNDGATPLIIEGVKASCGCTTPDWPKQPIGPGETGEITATYNSKGRIGKFNKAIRITSNAATPTKVLYIKGEVKKVKENEGMPTKKPSIVEE